MRICCEEMKYFIRRIYSGLVHFLFGLKKVALEPHKISIERNKTYEMSCQTYVITPILSNAGSTRRTYRLINRISV